MIDHAALPKPAEPREMTPDSDKLLSWVCGVATERADRRSSGHTRGPAG